MYRQGDVLIVAVDTIPDGAKRVARDNGRVILACGEVTGHAHAITERDVEKREYHLARGIAEYLDAPTGANILHEEHDTVSLPPGRYQIIHQRGYTPTQIVRVRD